MHAADSQERLAAVVRASEVDERAVVFACGDDELVGVLSASEVHARRGVLVIVGGPQYRSGSHRQFTLLARELAAAGYPVLRFDYRGMGDSAGAPRTFESVEADVHAAITAFVLEVPGLEEIVLWGLCDGASAALMHGADHPRVKGMILLNPWVRNETTLARSHVRHYYPRRVMQRDFWAKLFSGDMQLSRTIASALSEVRRSRTDDARPPGSFVERMREGLRRFPGSVLLLLSGNDITANEFLALESIDPEWARLLARNTVTRVVLPEADHTFSRPSWRAAVERLTADWLGAQ